MKIIQGYILIREERHIDPKFWVSESLEQLLEIANEVRDYWIKEYEPEEIDDQLYGDNLYFCSADDAFTIYIQPQEILINE